VSWYDEQVLALLRRFNTALCIHDLQGVESPLTATADFAYVRFHGPTGTYAGSYSGRELKGMAQKLNGLNGVHTVYAYFNNDADSHAVENANTLTRLAKSPSLRRWDEPPPAHRHA
jgi:uncharacterized protein YecE (DUF72 family)